MKQTKSINLAGLAFHMDEDALQRLETYLQQVESTLRSNIAEGEPDETDEVMRDIEARIAELFAASLNRMHTQVVEMPMVEAVITQLGSPQSYVTGEEAEYSSREDAKTQEQSSKKPHRRLYRDEEDKILGGVCSGLAAMLGWDPVWVRLLVAALTIITQGVMAVIYLFMWIVMPAAKTAAQRLEMRGEVASIENIQREVERMRQYADQHNLRQVLSTIFRVCFKILLAVIIIVLLIPLFAILVAGFAILVSGTSVLAALPFSGAFLEIMYSGNPWMIALGCFALFLMLALPVCLIVYLIVKLIANIGR